MILLEFRLSRNLQEAIKLFEKTNVDFRIETLPEQSGLSYIYFFEDDLRVQAQREALREARILEREDKRDPKLLSLPNLANPF